MPGFSSYDDIINEMTTNGKKLEWNFNKIGVAMKGAGFWHSMWTDAGTPGAGSNPAASPGAVGNNLTGSMNWAAQTPDLKSIVTLGAVSTQNCTLMLYDRLWGVGGLSSATTGAKTVNSGNLSRYGGPVASAIISGASTAPPIVITTSSAHGLFTGDVVTIASVGGNTAANGTWVVTYLTSTTFSLNDSTGNGAYTSGGTITRIANDVQAWAEVTTASTTTVGVMNLSSYTNQSGTAARAGGNISWPAAATVVGTMIGPFPLQAGDTGVRSIETGITIGTANTAGVFNALLIKPLAYLPLLANQWNERDLVLQMTSLPQVFDAASLAIAVLATSATALNLWGNLKLAYG